MISQLFTAGPFWTNPLFQSTVCIAVGLIASWLLRQRSARAHQVLFLAMIAAVAVPAMSLIVRHYELGMFVSSPPAAQPQPAEIPIVPIITEYEISPLPAIPNTYPLPAIETKIALPAAAVVREAKAKLPLSIILIWSWIIVSTILVFRLFLTFILGIRMIRRAHHLNSEKLRQALRIAKNKLGIDKPVEVLSDSKVSSPVIWCWSRMPALLVPQDAEQFEEDIDWVGMFCHELAHWSRLDHITGLFAELMVCVLPWHPLMWCAKRRLAGLSEQACDDWVVAGSRSPADYAESLLDLSPQGQLSFLPAVVGRKNGLENRVRRIVKDKCGNPRLGLCWAVVVTLFAACITIGAAFAQTRPADTEQTQECEELLTREKQQLLLEQKQLELLAEEMKQQQLTKQKNLELLTARKELEQLAEELKVQQMQHDELIYQMNLQKQVDDLTRELEALKQYQAEKAQLHDQMSSTIKEINKARQQLHTTVPEELVHSYPLLQDSERDNLVMSKNELQALKNRTRQQLEGLPKEADKLREKLKEIEAMIRTIDNRLGDHLEQQQRLQSRDEYEVKRKRLLSKRRELEDREKQIERQFEQAPDRKDAEKLLLELDQIDKRIREIDFELSSPQWCPEKQKATPSCSSCHADIDHIEVHRKSKDADYAKAELINRQSQWCAEMRAFEADVVAAKQKIIDANKTLENDLATLEKMQQEIGIFTIENKANLGTDIALFNKLKTMEANREQLAEKIERDKGVLAKYEEELKAAVERRDIYLKYKPPAGTEEEDIQRFIKAMEALKRRMEGQWHIKPPQLPQDRDFRHRQQGFQTTTPPSQQGQTHSPWQPQEQLQSRINQLQDQVSELRSEIKDLRKLLTDLVEHEKKRPELIDMSKDPLTPKLKKSPMLGRQWSESHEDNSSRRGKKGAEQSTDDILDIPLEGEKAEPTPRGKEHPEKSPDDINMGPFEGEKSKSKPPAD